jgi:hypothetical protein
MVYVTNGDAYNERFSIKVTGVGGNGEIASIWFNDSEYHDYNFDTINPGTTEWDEAFYWDGAFHCPTAGQYEVYKPGFDTKEWRRRAYREVSAKSGGTSAYIRVYTLYAPFGNVEYGDFAHANRHDPLVQSSFLQGYVNERLSGMTVMKFIGYVSWNDPRWPWSEDNIAGTGPKTGYPAVMPDDGWPSYGIGNFDPETKIGTPSMGDLWYKSSASTDPNDPPGPPVVMPENAEPDMFFPWGIKSGSGALFEWNGLKWENATTVSYPDGYTPKKLEMWEVLNLRDPRPEKERFQNTGFYWLDMWKLYTFSVDEKKFVHVDGKETIDGQKTLLYHP